MTGHVEFNIYDPVDNANVGRIAKQWGGIAREMFTKADIWGLKYAPDMTLDTKSVLLAAVFLIVSQMFIYICSKKIKILSSHFHVFFCFNLGLSIF